MENKDAEKILENCLQFYELGLNEYCTRKNSSAAKKYFQAVCEYGILFLDSSYSDEVSVELAMVLMGTGKYLNSLMDYKQASYCFKTAFDIVSGCRRLEWREVEILCNAFQKDLQCHLHTKDIEGAVLAINQKKPWLINLDRWIQVRQSLGIGYLDLGVAQLENTFCSSAVESLEEARSFLLQTPSFASSLTEARVMSSLGYCYLCNNDNNAATYLERACQIWKILNWPPDELDTIVNTLKYYVESQLRSQSFNHNAEICQQLLQLHIILNKFGNGLKVADAFTYLGMIAFHIENHGQGRAVTYFDQALTLYKQAPVTEGNRDEIAKLLRYIGVSSYNCRDFRRSAAAYTECLQLLEYEQPVSIPKLPQVAECCASLGFTYSRLRDFENMLKYYERALELKTRLGSEDLELIETNIGSLYHVKAVKYEDLADVDNSKKYYGLAESAFTKALRYSWKSFPFINYGYYLFCRGEYSQAVHILQQGFLNGVLDKDTVEFDHTEDPILIPDLKFELEDREDIRIPSPIISLYLKVLSQATMGNLVGANHTTEQLQRETNTCKYQAYYVEGYGHDRMKALSFSLLGYAYRCIDCHAQAYLAFQQSLAILPDYRAAKYNLQIHQSAIVHKTGK